MMAHPSGLPMQWQQPPTAANDNTDPSKQSKRPGRWARLVHWVRSRGSGVRREEQVASASLKVQKAAVSQQEQQGRGQMMMNSLHAMNGHHVVKPPVAAPSVHRQELQEKLAALKGRATAMDVSQRNALRAMGITPHIRQEGQPSTPTPQPTRPSVKPTVTAKNVVSLDTHRPTTMADHYQRNLHVQIKHKGHSAVSMETDIAIAKKLTFFQARDVRDGKDTPIARGDIAEVIANYSPVVEHHQPEDRKAYGQRVASVALLKWIKDNPTPAPKTPREKAQVLQVEMALTELKKADYEGYRGSAIREYRKELGRVIQRDGAEAVRGLKGAKHDEDISIRLFGAGFGKEKIIDAVHRASVALVGQSEEVKRGYINKHVVKPIGELKVQQVRAQIWQWKEANRMTNERRLDQLNLSSAQQQTPSQPTPSPSTPPPSHTPSR
ncbi:MAG: hypothetical protein AAGC93_18425 [Cyanobacteria bacterium P01_F01_bin.53]